MDCLISPTPFLLRTTPFVGVIAFILFFALAFVNGYRYFKLRKFKKKNLFRDEIFWRHILVLLVLGVFLVFPIGYSAKTYLLVYVISFTITLAGIFVARKYALFEVKQWFWNATIAVLAIFVVLFVIKYSSEGRREARENSFLQKGLIMNEEDSLRCGQKFLLF